MKKLVPVLAVLLVFLSIFTLAACTPEGGGEQNPKPKAAVIANGVVKDSAFNQMSFDALNGFSKKFDITVKDVANGDDFKTHLQSLVTAGNKLIISANSVAAETVAEVAAQNLSVTFIVVDTEITAPSKNITGIFFKAKEAAFLAGYTAAAVTQTGQIGFIGGENINAVNVLKSGYQQGMAYANAEKSTSVTLASAYTNSFTNKEAGKTAAGTMYGNGADIIFQAAGTSGLGVIEKAVELEKQVIGADYDQTSIAPQNVVCSVLKDVEGILKGLINDYLDGVALGGKNKIVGLESLGVSLAPNNDLMSEALQIKIFNIMTKIISGEIHIDSKIA